MIETTADRTWCRWILGGRLYWGRSFRRRRLYSSSGFIEAHLFGHYVGVIYN